MGREIPNNNVQSILVLCVNYHNEKDTHDFVRCLLELESSELLHIIVVDNSERNYIESCLSSLVELDPRVIVLNPKTNLGYFGGAAWGLRQYLGSAPLPEWIIVSNTDILFPHSDFFSKLFEFYPGGNSTVIAPAIYSTLSETNQNPYMVQRPSKSRMIFYNRLFHNYSIYSAYQLLGLLRKKLRVFTRSSRALSGNKNNDSKNSPVPIYAPHGSFILFHRNYFESGGSLDHGAFLFGEEIFVAETARRLGISIVYDPRLEVTHYEHATTGLIKNRKMVQFEREASSYCINNFFIDN